MRMLGIALASVAALGVGAAHADSAGDGAVTDPVAWWLEKMDVDDDGSVTLNEFDAGRARQFASLDADRDGAISAAERQAAIEDWNRKFPNAAVEFDPGDGDVNRTDFEAETASLFEKLDVDGDNVISGGEIEAARVAG